MIASIAGLMGILAQIRFNVGPIPYTMQNMGVILAALLLSPTHAFLAVLLYLFLIAIGLPFASGFSGGPMVLFGYTSGYLWGFLLAAPLFSFVSRRYLKIKKTKLSRITKTDLLFLTILSMISFLPVYLLGFTVFYHYAVPGTGLFEWSLNVASFLDIMTSSRVMLLFIISVLIFIPQDLLMDHLFGISIAKQVSKMLEDRGIAV